ncbi:MAG: hypothetical protein BroJett038_23300 [Chloroflexota bacterium]|nr:MAG: hypothetical protein BroJett038_23300 [Chloroflexota bacterium]
MLRSLNLKITTILLLLMAVISACNLTSAPEEQLSLTEIPTTTPQPTRTAPPTGGIPTTLPLTAFVVPTLPSGQIPPTTIALPPTWVASAPTSTPVPISIVILSPIPGNVVAGNVQVLGAAIHPQFLQYQLEYGPDPNPGNLWYPATGIVQTPVLNGFLGIWNTTVVQDSIYQLRLRVTLRDGSSLSTVVNSIRIQNRVPTPVPSNTPTTPRPIAAFTQDRTSGQAPLVVRFTNQSSGSISSYSWSFGDGGTSPEINPVYTFRSPGVYNVTLTVAGPGGSSNVSRQINVQSQTPPVAGFTQDKTSGPSPLTVKFTNTSTGTITAYAWNFGDGQTSTEQNPTHQFTAVGTYNVILTVTGPGGSSSVTRKITVEDPVVPPPKAAFITDKTSGDAPLTVQFINQSTGQIQSYNWDFGDGETSADANPLHTFTKPGDYTVTLTVIGPGGQNTAQAAIKVTQKPDAPTAAFTQSATSGDVPLTIQFTDQSTGSITTHTWDFGDGNTSSEASPSHTFTTAGTYTVILTVTGPDGSDDAQVIISATQPAAAPVAAFTANPTSGDAPLTVQFTNQSSGDITTYAWDFGDGGSSNEVDPSHTFNAPGAYTVTLTVSGPGGSSQASALITASEVQQPPAPPITDPLAFVTNRDGNNEIYMLDVDGSLINLTNHPASDTAPAWSPDGRQIVFVSDRDGNNEIYVMDADGANLVNLTNHPASDTAPAWSPDGRQIVFVSDRDGNNEIYVMDADGANLINLTNHPASDTAPALAPVGQTLAFVSDRDGNNEIYLLGADGNPVNISSHPASDIAPAWSPDGRQIVFVSDRDGSSEIYVMDADGANLINLTNHPASDTAPDWSPDGSQIAFVSDRDGGSDIYVMNADGTSPVNLTNHPANDSSPAWRR